MNILLVIDLESYPPTILGEFASSDEDYINYWREDDGTLSSAPEDCVTVVPGYRYKPGYPAHTKIRVSGFVVPPSNQ